MMAHAYNPSHLIQAHNPEDPELEASLGYIASLIKAKTKQQKILFQTPSFA
jgi:hypothetical protein